MLPQLAFISVALSPTPQALRQLSAFPSKLAARSLGASHGVVVTMVQPNGPAEKAGMKQGDVVLIWGASGGLGSYATQYAVNGGAIPICVVSSPEKADRLEQIFIKKGVMADEAHDIGVAAQGRRCFLEAAREPVGVGGHFGE